MINGIEELPEVMGKVYDLILVMDTQAYALVKTHITVNLKSMQVIFLN